MIEIDGPFCRVSEPDFEMLIPRWEGCGPETAKEADATITLPDGTRRYATFMTLDVVSRVMDRWKGTGENLGGQYFWCSDLIIIRQPGFASMIDAVRDMITTGGIESACSVLPPDDKEQCAD
ncbi:MULTISPECIES: hypothetical protein [Streptosporangium]|uniref:Uncharacterized protein n=1 Tax=Streptosporangium brasiliense TaxID=47480 RepID=A0ABT9RKB9_9ACTN|nr:hypothetical protein [Streptosporangium brasiliense]MDP9868715.1 hypothetical protein [Streptosporangium brasiliense]